jgi:DNA recombination protein RmuC
VDVVMTLAILALAALAVALLLVLVLRRPAPPPPPVDVAPLLGRLLALEQGLERNERRLQEELARNRTELGGALSTRLGEGFRQVSEQMERVQRGLGEMHKLAQDVGGLQRVLANVKTRGTWGEYQLANLLEQVLAPSQYQANVQTREGSGERVEFAIRLPGGGEGDEVVLLPIDAKFPLEDYQRLVEAAERADAVAVEAAGRQLEVRVRACAQDISSKYLNPPRTTDFGVLYLPTEGLYAEVARRPGLLEALQREQRVTVAGPTTLAALLNSLQMGFRTLAIQKRSSEVWQLLGAVRTEFQKFGEVLDKARDKVRQAGKVLEEDLATRTRAMDRKLRAVQQLSDEDARRVLERAPEGDGGDDSTGSET